MSGRYNPNQRNNALKRAKKFEKLFNGPIFDTLLEAAESGSEKTFKDALMNQGYDGTEANWLWNYLKNCKKGYYGPVPEAPDAVLAGTGW